LTETQNKTRTRSIERIILKNDAGKQFYEAANKLINLDETFKD